MTLAPKKVEIYTDGSCDSTTGHGGWAYLLRFDGGEVLHQKIEAAYEANTTNNRMELSAAVMALRSLSEPCEVTLVTDSQYLRKAFTDGWLKNWQRNGWQTANKSPVKNKDLWLELLNLEQEHRLHWRWTKGHAGHYENEWVDSLALEARKTRKARLERQTIAKELSAKELSAKE